MTTLGSKKSIDINTLTVLSVVYFIIYAGEIANLNVSIDDEFLAFSKTTAFLEIGRWVSFVVRATLFPQPIIPLLPYIIFGASVIFSYLCVLKVLKVELGPYELVIFFALFCSHPIWYTQLEFAANTIPISIGVVMSTVGFYLYKKRFKEGRTLSRITIDVMVVCIFIAVAFGAYQTFALVFLSLVLGSVLLEYCRNNSSVFDSARDAVVAFCLTVGGVVMSWVISKAFMTFFNLSTSQYGQNFFHIKDLATDGVGIIGRTLRAVYFAYVSAWSISPATPFFFGSLIAIFLIVLLLIQKTASRGALTIFIGLLLILVPFALNPFTGGELPLRAYLAIPFVVLLSVIVSYNTVYGYFNRLLILGATVMCIVMSLYVQSVMQARNWVVAKHDHMLASAIDAAVRDLQIADDPVVLNVSGYKSVSNIYPAIPTTTTGFSFFEWDRGNPHRVLAYMRLVGLTDYALASTDATERTQRYFDEMPEWPLKGSVKYVDGVVLVKLSSKVAQRNVLGRNGDSIRVLPMELVVKSLNDVAPGATSDELTVTGNDPFVVYSIPEGSALAGSDSLRLSLTCAGNLATVPVQIFWATRAEPNFAEDRSISFNYETARPVLPLLPMGLSDVVDDLSAIRIDIADPKLCPQFRLSSPEFGRLGTNSGN